MTLRCLSPCSALLFSQASWSTHQAVLQPSSVPSRPRHVRQRLLYGHRYSIKLGQASFPRICAPLTARATVHRWTNKEKCFAASEATFLRDGFIHSSVETQRYRLTRRKRERGKGEEKDRKRERLRVYGDLVLVRFARKSLMRKRSRTSRE